MALYRFTLTSYESAIHCVSHKIKASKRLGNRFMALSAIKPPIDKPQRITFSRPSRSINRIKSLANKSILRCDSSSVDFPNPLISNAITRCVDLKKSNCSCHIDLSKGKPCKNTIGVEPSPKSSYDKLILFTFTVKSYPFVAVAMVLFFFIVLLKKDVVELLTKLFWRGLLNLYNLTRELYNSQIHIEKRSKWFNFWLIHQFIL